MDNLTQAGGVLVVVGGMALVVLGVFQYLLSQTKKNDEARTKTFGELEAEKLENVRLQGQLFVYEGKYAQMKQHAQKYYRLYRRYETLYKREIEKPTIDKPIPKE